MKASRRKELRINYSEEKLRSGYYEYGALFRPFITCCVGVAFDAP